MLSNPLFISRIRRHRKVQEFQTSPATDPSPRATSDKMAVIKSKSKRRKNLINTEFSPSEWNINNLNKFKKWLIPNLGASELIKIFYLRADAARQKSEALRNLASQLIEEHKDYTRKNEQAELSRNFAEWKHRQIQGSIEGRKILLHGEQYDCHDSTTFRRS